MVATEGAPVRGNLPVCCSLYSSRCLVPRDRSNRLEARPEGERAVAKAIDSSAQQCRAWNRSCVSNIIQREMMHVRPSVWYFKPAVCVSSAVFVSTHETKRMCLFSFCRIDYAAGRDVRQNCWRCARWNGWLCVDCYIPIPNATPSARSEFFDEAIAILFGWLVLEVSSPLSINTAFCGTCK